MPQRGLIGPIISRFENRGFKLAAIKLVTPSKEHLQKHYEDLADKPFFPGLIACTSKHPPPPKSTSLILPSPPIQLTPC
jgi:nucleoside-diphosphate kinase